MRRTSPLLIAAAVLGVVVAAARSEAQYFGQNKVQHRGFDFEVLSTANFDVHYYPEEREHAEQVARMAERWYARLARIFQYELQGRQPLILYASAPHFRQTNTTPGDVGEGTGGFTDLYKRRVVMPSAGPLAETDHVLGHELVHAFQFSMSSGASTGSSLPPITRLPLWFVEGMAEYLSLGPLDPQTAMWMRDACRAEKLPRLKDLGNPRYFPYRWGHAFFAFVGGKWGDAKVAELMKAAARSGDVDGTLKQVLDIKPEELTKQWHEVLRAAYGPFIESRRTASTYGPAVISEKNAGELNVGPVLSPDGQHLAFLSEKDLFSVDLFVADTETGKVRQKLLSTATNPHFDSLQFIDSAGAWSRAGDRFALAAVRSGRGAIVITDPTRGTTVREVPLPDLDEAKGPTWSPDGRSLAFSALRGGLLDLYVLDLESGRTRRLTTDAFAEMQPAWSPDGREIAFVTDRFSSRLPDLAFGNYRLAVVDVASGAIAPLPSFEGAKHIDPHWSHDGKSLFFVSDRGGASNVYRLDRASGKVYQVTDLATGVSGITALSPSLSVAADAPRVAFAVREDGKYRIHRIDDPEKLAGQRVETAPSTEPPAAAALLPPVERKGQAVADYRRDPDRGLPGPDLPPPTPYRSRLSIDAVGAPTIEVGADRFGGYVAGGIALSFSDMLGDHNVSAIVDANGRVQDIGGQLAYTNLKKKWDWAVGVQRIPYLTAGAITQSVTEIGGQPVLLEQIFEERQTNHSVFGAVYRPFSRAFRLELGAAYQRISFSREVRTQAFSLVTGEFLGEGTEDLPTASALNLGQVSAALVYDTSVYGATSPILGRRFRLEASPTLGSLTYTGVLADFRQYVMPKRPFTLAFRALHYGRYGRSSEDPRFYDLYLGYPYLVRGYDSGSFTSDECGLSGGCPVYEGLFGSRMLVGNFELRFPLLGAFGAKSLYGPVPVEIALFADGGVAWRKGESPALFGGERDAVGSVGVTARVNVFGFAVVALDFARPLDRPEKGWVFQFSLSPGF